MMKSPYFWFTLVGLIVCVDFAAFGYLIARSSNDPTFAVEENYYEKAMDWDSHMAQERRNAELGWIVEARVDDSVGNEGVLTITVTDRDSDPIGGARVQIEAFANIRASEKHEMSGVTDERGVCAVRVADVIGGLWEARVKVMTDSEHVFTHIARFEMPTGEGAAP